MVPRIILDTNVLINGVQDENSYAHRIITSCLEGELQPILSKPILRENQFKTDELVIDEEYLNILDDYYDLAEMVLVRGKLRGVTDDPDDDKFIEASQEGKVDYIITDDAHLLDLEKYNSTQIMTPNEFWHHYREEYNEESADEEWQKFAKNIGIG